MPCRGRVRAHDLERESARVWPKPRCASTTDVIAPSRTIDGRARHPSPFDRRIAQPHTPCESCPARFALTMARDFVPISAGVPIAVTIRRANASNARAQSAVPASSKASARNVRLDLGIRKHLARQVARSLPREGFAARIDRISVLMIGAVRAPAVRFIARYT
jgi:hypothetical protein